MESDYRAVRTGCLNRLRSIPRDLVQIQSCLSLSLCRSVLYNVTITFQFTLKLPKVAVFCKVIPDGCVFHSHHGHRLS